jgi:hypothetical protein
MGTYQIEITDVKWAYTKTNKDLDWAYINTNRDPDWAYTKYK